MLEPRPAAWRRKIGLCFGATVFIAVLSGLVIWRNEQDGFHQFRGGNYDASFKTFTRHAASGDSAAINFIGIHYYLGVAVDRDYIVAAQWFERAARSDNADAQRNLGVLYWRGWGVPRDNVKAYGWLYQATSLGNHGAREYLKAVNQLITPNQTLQARRWIAAQLR